MKLFDLFDIYLQNSNFAESTYKTVKNYIEKVYKIYFNNTEIEIITTKDINNFIKFEKAIGLKDITIYTYFNRLRIIFNYAIKNKMIAENPCKNAQIKCVTYARRNLDYSKKYIKQLLKLFKGNIFYTIVLLDLHTGLRKGELLSLKKENFIYRKILFLNLPQKIYIKSNKTGKTRIIALDLKISLYMASYLKNLNLKDNLFTFSTYYISDNFNKVFKSKTNKNNIKQIRFADIRHIHASYLLAHNKNKAHCIKMVQERLGHTDIQQTFNTYTHILQEEQEKGIKCLNKF